MNPKQCRMARAGLGWTVTDLAQAAGVRPATVSNFERGKAALTTTVESLSNALINTGLVSFEGDNCVCCLDQ